MPERGACSPRSRIIFGESCRAPAQAHPEQVAEARAGARQGSQGVRGTLKNVLVPKTRGLEVGRVHPRRPQHRPSRRFACHGLKLN